MSMQSLKSILQPLLPNFFFERHFFEIHLWQWIVLIAAAVLAYFVSYAGARFTVFFARKFLLDRVYGLDKHILRRMFAPLRYLFLIIIVAIVVPFLDLAKTASLAVGTGLRLATVIAIMWLCLRIVDVFVGSLSQRLIEKGRASLLPAVPLIRRGSKIVIGILASLAVLQNLDIKITAILATLGVGSLAVALASQKTLENLFGGLMLLLDQPIRVGQECKFGNQQGVVEDIGLRSTRIRTLERSILAIPNGEFSQLQIENLTQRDRIRLTSVIGLRYETTPDQLRSVMISIREILYAHPKVDSIPARVRFINFGLQSLDIEIVAYVLTAVNNEFLAVKEDILLRIMDAVYESGTAFAIPSQVMYQHDHEFLDEKRKNSAEAKIAEMRTKKELPLPEFSDEQIARLDDTIDYPPHDSANPDPEGRYS